MTCAPTRPSPCFAPTWFSKNRSIERLNIIFSDQDKIGQLLLNLLSNADKFTQEGRFLLAANRDGDNLRIVVADTGIGISAEALPRIFKEFQQAVIGTTRGFTLVAAAYLALFGAYSGPLKHVVIIDVLAIAIGFVLRAVAGALAIQVVFSDWLLVCTILLALFLALAKRRHELVTLPDAVSHRAILAEYSPYLLDQMIAVVNASCLTAYAFYTLAPETVTKYRTERLALTIPFVIYGIFRYLYLVHRKEQGGRPSDVLLADRPLLLAVALWAVLVVVIVYTAPGAPVPRGL